MTHPFKLPQLPYDYNALEPYIDEKTMTIHHTKHHQTYVDKLNAALEGHKELHNKSVEDLLKNLAGVPDAIRTAVRNHGGGHLNHSFFWPIMSPEKQDPKGEVLSSIEEKFGGFDKFKEQFSTAAVGHFGSGWCWLVLNKPTHEMRQPADGQLEIMTTPNQDNPISQHRMPILGLDLWEHSYYLKYQNKRPDYIAAWFNVVNWEEVDKHFKQAMK